MSFYLAPPLPTHYLVHFTRSGVLTMTIVLMLPTTFRLEVCSSAFPILTFTTWDSGCIYLLVFCSWRPLVAYLLMCWLTLHYWRSPPQSALEGGAALRARPRGKHQFFQNCWVIDDFSSYSFLLTLWSLFFCFCFPLHACQKFPLFVHILRAQQPTSLLLTPSPRRKPGEEGNTWSWNQTDH